MENWIIRKIKQEDNVAVAALIRSVFDELSIPKVGTAYADAYLDEMFEEYNKPKATYYVVEHNSRIVGCCGIAPLDSKTESICELQKMYFLSETRGNGIGAAMIDICMMEARNFDYKQCYLETMPFMQAAQKLYKKQGFNYLEKPLGNTGHDSCTVWMLKEL